MIHSSPLPDVDIPHVTLHAFVLEGAAARGDKPALIDGPSGRSITYAELDEKVCQLAGGLVARGFVPGEVVAVMSPNLPEYAIVLLGVAMAGGVVTTVNPAYTEREVHSQLVDAGARLLVTVSACLTVAQAGAEGTSITEVVVLDEAGDIPTLHSLYGPALSTDVAVDPDDVVVLPYSSGTTGVNKGVMLSHYNLVANLIQIIDGAGLHSEEKFIAVLPFFHIYGMQVLMNAGLRLGVTTVTMPKFDLPQFLQLHAQYGITRSFVAPPIVVALAKHPMVDNYDLSSLQQVFSGAAPLSAELALEAGRRIGCEVVQGYGMTEMSPVSHLTPPGGFKPGSVGVTVANTELRIVDLEGGAELDIDADGEILVRGPQVMKGYLNNPEATASTLDSDGWLHTGDVGHIDADGHVFIVDRVKELIKYKGFQVPPAELEGLLLAHPAIADAAVIGRVDESVGEVPVAYVVLRPDSEATASDIKSFVAAQVSYYKQLADVVFTDTIPKSTSGKILRRILRDSDISSAQQP